MPALGWNGRLLFQMMKACLVITLACLPLAISDFRFRSALTRAAYNIATEQGVSIDNSKFNGGFCFSELDGLHGYGSCMFHNPGEHLASLNLERCPEGGKASAGLAHSLGRWPWESALEGVTELRNDRRCMISSPSMQTHYL